MDASPPRMIAVWCPDWPVTTARLEAGLSAEAPIAVLAGNDIVACSHSARAAGVRRGLRRREAQARCPELAVLPRNEDAEARTFEPVIAGLESIAPGVEITRPGLAAINVRGPTRYFGGETGVLHALSRAVMGLPQLGGADVLIGIADGAFAAEQSARRGVIVDPGGSAQFLAGLPIETLDPSGNSPLIDLLRRLGLLTLGAFAALSARDVLARFGPSGAWAHRQAGGLDDRPVAARRPPVELTVTLDLEPPVDRVDTVAFSARGAAEQFVGDLGAHGLACACLELQASSENGEETVRRWRHAGVLGSSDVVDRIRWQLEGWLSRPDRPSGGVTRLRLVPIETVPSGSHQQTLWGASGAENERAHRALARVQTLLGHGSVLAPVLEGGRDPGQRTRLVAWGDEPAAVRSPQQPWPGSLPAPAPSVLLDPPRAAHLLDATGHSVVVTDRGAMPAPPALFAIGGEKPVAVTSWAGPWPVDERWWSASAARQVVRCQVVDVRGRAYLVSGSMPAGEWSVDAVYD
jgi:protein ImuB